MIAFLLLACRDADGPPLAPAAAVWVEARHVDAGQPVRVHTPAGVTLPEVEGLTATRAGEDNGEIVWEVRGDAGSYVIEVPTTGGAADAPTTTRLDLDIGVDGPSGGPMEDLASLPPPTPPVWPRVLAAVAGVAFLVAVGAMAWKRLRPVPPPPPPEPPDRIARREWRALRDRGDLDADALAGALSSVYRRYLEAVYGWPATSRTSREILDALAGDLPVVQLERARRLLFAMDIVRFSDRSTHEDFFVSLDADFEALLAAAPRVTRA